MGLYMHLVMIKAQFETFYGLGTEEHEYMNFLKGPVRICFHGDIIITILELCTTHHLEPLLLLGADVLYSGRNTGNLKSISIGLDGIGLLLFRRGILTRSVTLFILRGGEAIA